MAVSRAWHKEAQPHRRLRSGMRGEDVKALQRAMNIRLVRRGYKRLKLDGEFGKATRAAWITLCRLLGFDHRFGTEGNQALMRRPWNRPKRMVRREHKRWKVVLRERAARKARRGPEAAVRWWASHLNVKEHPPGSNGGPGISDWEREFGFGRVPWCGIFAGKGLRAAGVKVTSRIAGVALIGQDARHGVNGFRRWHGPRGGRRGWLAVLFGYNVHVEGIERVFAWGYKTCGGNTSCEGCSGSQSNGGQSARRNRSFGVVHGVAEPAY